jgi:hypothetical protein
MTNIIDRAKSESGLRIDVKAFMRKIEAFEKMEASGKGTVFR